MRQCVEHDDARRLPIRIGQPRRTRPGSRCTQAPRPWREGLPIENSNWRQRGRPRRHGNGEQRSRVELHDSATHGFEGLEKCGDKCAWKVPPPDPSAAMARGATMPKAIEHKPDAEHSAPTANVATNKRARMAARPTTLSATKP